MLKKVSIITHDVFDDTEDASDHDEHTNTIEHEDRLLPGYVAVVRLARRVTAHADMPDDCCDDEQAEHGDLEKQSDNDKGLAHVLARSLSHQATTGRLDEERKDIANDEQLGKPVDADDGVLLAANGAHGAAECHVDCCGEESGCDEEEDGLDDERTERGSIIMGLAAGGVADDFNCI